MKDADILVFASPIYFYEMCGQMKTLLDRTNPLFPSDCAVRDICLLATAADAGEQATDGAIRGLRGWIASREKASLVPCVTIDWPHDVGHERAGRLGDGVTVAIERIK